MEYEKVYRSESGTEVAFKIKAECHTQEKLEEALGFFAKSSRQFYLEAGNTLRPASDRATSGNSNREGGNQ